MYDIYKNELKNNFSYITKRKKFNYMLRKSKSIKELYEECKVFDLVITNDAPLARGLNRCVDYPRLGLLAMTPKQIASKYSALYYDKIYEKYEVVLNAYRLSGKDLSYIHHIYSRIFDIYQHCGKLESIELFVSEKDKKFIEYLGKFDTIESVMENFDENFYDNMKIAVIGEDLFTELDKQVLPKKGVPPARIDYFINEEFELPEIFVSPSKIDLIVSIIDLIKPEVSEQVAVVLNKDSEFDMILQAKLRQNNFKVNVKSYLSNEISTRNILYLLELSTRYSDLNLKEISELSGSLGISPEIKYNNYKLDYYAKKINKNNKIKSICSLLENINNFSYKDFLLNLKNQTGIDVHPELVGILELMELYDTKISDDNILQLDYFINNFDVELDSEKEGVLVVNALGSAFIDRELIIYLGLDNSWFKLNPEKEYLDKKTEEEKNLKKFQILLTQGSQRFYFANTVELNRDVVPCYYFNILCDKTIDTFSHNFFKTKKIITSENIKLYEPKIMDLKFDKPHEINSISPSKLNQFFLCPKYYSFVKLIIEMEEQFNYTKGTLFHDFAEFYFNHPEFVKEKIDDIKNSFASRLLQFQENINKNILMTDINIGCDVIMKFIDDYNFRKDKLEIPRKPSEKSLMSEFNKEIIYSNTEVWTKNDELIKGRFDLKCGNTIVDYKSGSISISSSDAIKKTNINLIIKYENYEFDFQPISYITSFFNEIQGQKINFIYNFILANRYNTINPNAKSEKNITNIIYIPFYFIDYIVTEEFYEELKITKSKDFIEKLGFENYKSVINHLKIDSSQYLIDETVSEKITEALLSKSNQLNFSCKNFRKNNEETFKRDIITPISEYIRKKRLANNDIGYLYKEDIETFIDFVKQKLAEMNRYLKDKFPAEPVFDKRIICKECEYLNICLENKLWN